MICRHWAFVIAMVGFFAPQFSTAFSTAPLQRTRGFDTALQGGLFGGGAGNALKNVFGGDNDKQQGNNDNGGEPATVFDIPVGNIKPGPLRFFLQIYIVGQKNSQDSQTWLPREADDGGLEIYFKDASAMCKIAMEPNTIKVERHGQKPSLQYLLQESIMLHGVLDELNTVAFEADVEDGKRLLVVEEGVIQQARETLPARKD